jgi:hypothetical protein
MLVPDGPENDEVTRERTKCLSDRPDCKIERPHIHEADGKVVYCEFD